MPDYLTRILCFNEGNSDSLFADKVVPDPRTMKGFERSKLNFFVRNEKCLYCKNATASLINIIRINSK